MGKIIGYARVSTKSQAKEGNSLEQQKEEILNKYNTAEVFSESYTGTKTDRPIFNKIINELQEGDTLVATFDIEKEPTTDIEVCNQVVKYLSEAFPHNKVMGMFNGVELSVIREE